MNHQCTDPKLGSRLHAYELGALESADVQRFEAHLLECEYCFEQIAAFEEQAYFLHSGHLVRKEVKDRLAAPDTASLLRRIWGRLWPDSPLILRPAFLLLIIIVMLYPAYLGLPVSDDCSVRPVQSISLMPNRSGSTGVLSASADRDGLISFIVPDAVPGHPYRLEITTSDGRTVMTDPSFVGFDQYRIGRLLIPARVMKAGQYRLTVSDPENDSVILSGTFNFVIED